MDLIYKDDQFIAINKPGGLLSIQDGYQVDLPNAKSILEKKFGKIWTVHRLDKDTSGVLVFALNPVAHKLINDQFEERKVEKQYRALVSGNLPEREFEISIPLKINGDRKHRTVPDLSSGKDARTAVKYLHPYLSANVISVHPLTGYTHQIRAHLFFSGFPIVGDKLYWKPGDSPNEFLSFPRLALHAYQIEFTHPVNQTKVTIIAPFPPGLEFLQS